MQEGGRSAGLIFYLMDVAYDLILRVRFVFEDIYPVESREVV